MTFWHRIVLNMYGNTLVLKIENFGLLTVISSENRKIKPNATT